MQLILMRHAEAEGNSPTGDHGRRLTAQGRGAAERVGEKLGSAGIDYAIVSTSTRTRETFDALSLGCTVEYADAIYEQDARAILSLVADVADDVDTLLVVGHSPVIPALAVRLTEHTLSTSDSDELLRHFPTATFAVVDFEGNWEQFADLRNTGYGKLLEVDRGVRSY